MDSTAISAFDMLKIGIGPSSSHTLGPWRAAERWLRELEEQGTLAETTAVEVHLYGSLALTGTGHATDKALILALQGLDPTTVEVSAIPSLVAAVTQTQAVQPRPGLRIPFDPATAIVFHRDQQLPGHANGLRFRARRGGAAHQEVWEDREYYSVGGGFVVAAGETDTASAPPPRPLPFPFDTADELLATCASSAQSIAAVTRANEQAWRGAEETHRGMMRIWETMRDSVWRGCFTGGELPGGLHVVRRAYRLHRELTGTDHRPRPAEWLEGLRNRSIDVSRAMRWISCFALAVNEENAAMGRVVTAPTNGAAGVIPAVLMQYLVFTPEPPTDRAIVEFLLVSATVGALFKKNATISAAMGGCQAEIGVSSAMAAAALTEARGGNPEQALMAAEIAMEHHLGLTCDPIAGLVQIPCIERNTMGAVKAINAAELALASRPGDARVSLDQVIASMWETAQDMHVNYKETSLGGLAVNIPVNVSEC